MVIWQWMAHEKFALDPIQVNTYKFKDSAGQQLAPDLQICDMSYPRLVTIDMSCYQEYVALAMRVSCMSHGPCPSLESQTRTHMFSVRVCARHTSGFDLLAIMEEKLTLLQAQVQHLQARLQAAALAFRPPTPGASGLSHQSMDLDSDDLNLPEPESHDNM